MKTPEAVAAAVVIEKQCGESLQSLGARLVATYEHDPERELRVVCAMFVARALAAHQVVVMLAELGYLGEAYGAMRTVCELDIDLACIASDTTGALLREFVDGSHHSAKRSLDALNQRAEANTNPQRSQHLKEVIKEGGQYPDFAPWSRLNVQERAARGERTELALTAYAEGCAAIHPCFDSLNYVCAQRPGHRGGFVIGPTIQSARPIYYANACLGLLIVTAAVELGQEVAAKETAAVLETIGQREHVVTTGDPDLGSLVDLPDA